MSFHFLLPRFRLDCLGQLVRKSCETIPGIHSPSTKIFKKSQKIWLLVGLRVEPNCKVKETEPENCLIHYLALDRRIPRDGCQILDSDDQVVGTVLSGGYSPLHKKPMGTALVQKMAYVKKFDSSWSALLRDNKIPIDIGLPALKRIP